MGNRWPEEFRDRVATEISGLNGVPLMPQNPFKVEIGLADSEEIQTDFEVGQPDGSISHVHYDPYGLGLCPAIMDAGDADVRVTIFLGVLSGGYIRLVPIKWARKKFKDHQPLPITLSSVLDP